MEWFSSQPKKFLTSLTNFSASSLKEPNAYFDDANANQPAEVALHANHEWQDILCNSHFALQKRKPNSFGESMKNGILSIFESKNTSQEASNKSKYRIILKCFGKHAASPSVWLVSASNRWEEIKEVWNWIEKNIFTYLSALHTSFRDDEKEENMEKIIGEFLLNELGVVMNVPMEEGNSTESFTARKTKTKVAEALEEFAPGEVSMYHFEHCAYVDDATKKSSSSGLLVLTEKSLFYVSAQSFLLLKKIPLNCITNVSLVFDEQPQMAFAHVVSLFRLRCGMCRVEHRSLNASGDAVLASESCGFLSNCAASEDTQTIYECVLERLQNCADTLNRFTIDCVSPVGNDVEKSSLHLKSPLFAGESLHPSNNANEDAGRSLTKINGYTDFSHKKTLEFCRHKFFIFRRNQSLLFKEKASCSAIDIQESKGMLFVLSDFVCFSSFPNQIPLTVRINAQAIKDIRMETFSSVIFNQKRVTAECENGCVFKFFGISDKNLEKLVEILRKLTTKPLFRLENNQNLEACLYKATSPPMQRENADYGKWASFFNKKSAKFELLDFSEAIMCRNDRFYVKVVLKGVPDRVRSQLWSILGNVSDSYAEFAIEYQKIQQKLDADLKSDTQKLLPRKIVDEIERDLRRTLPEHDFFHTTAGIDTLRRVLKAIAVKTPFIGYTQGMNMISGIALLYLDEVSAYGMLTNLFSHILSDQYCKTLVGSVIDQKIFERLISDNLPAVWASFERLSVPVSLLSVSWFVSLFTTVLSVEDACTFMDGFLWHGIPFIFWFGLAVLQLNREAIIACKDDDSLIDLIKRYFRSQKFQMKRCIECAISHRSNVSLETILSLRNVYRISTLQQIEKSQRRVVITRLAAEFKLISEAEVEAIYQTIQNIVLFGTAEAKLTDSLTFTNWYEACKYLLNGRFAAGPAHSNVFMLRIYDWFRGKNHAVGYKIVFIVYEKLKKATSIDCLHFVYDCHCDVNSGLFLLDVWRASAEYLLKWTDPNVACCARDHIGIHEDVFWAHAKEAVQTVDSFVDLCVSSSLVKLFSNKEFIQNK